MSPDSTPTAPSTDAVLEQAAAWRDAGKEVALAALGGDQSARPIVRAQEAEVVRFATDDPGIFHDIDTLADPDVQ